MESIILKGRGASKGVAEGAALVIHDTIAFLSDISITEGIITYPQSSFTFSDDNYTFITID